MNIRTTHDAVAAPMLRALLIGTALQLAMVTAGHFSAPVANLFGVLGVSISFAVGVLYALWARRPGHGGALAGGAIAGGACALAGIAVSVLLGDVPALILLFGTAASAVTGALGGLLGHRLARSRSPVVGS